MIFRPAVAHLIVAGRKTMLRRLIVASREARRANGTPYTTAPWRPVVGREEAVRRPVADAAAKSGWRYPSVGRVEITMARTELAGAVSFEDARAEGFRTRDDFKAGWVRQHDTDWLRRREQLPAGQDIEDGELVARFDARWAGVLLWVVSFELAGDQPMFLAPASRPRGSEHGYTTNSGDALPAEPEVIDPSRLHPDWQTRAAVSQRAAGEASDAARLSGLSHPDEQLRELRRMALERGIDITDDVRVIERRKAAIQRRLDAIERKVAGRRAAA